MKILCLDIETSPHIIYDFRLYGDRSTGLNQIIEPTRMLCFAAKWVGSKRVLFHSEFKDGKEGMVRALHALLDECDVLLTFNGIRFDEKHTNREMAEVGLTPPSPYHHVDLFRQVRSLFALASNKLDYVATWLGLKGKFSHSGFELWKRCMAGDPKAWREMERYNRQDVVLTDEAYLKVRPWFKTHPHPGLFGGAKDGCTRCGGTNLERRGFKASNALVYQQYQCKDCGAWCRSRTSVDRTETR